MLDLATIHTLMEYERLNSHAVALELAYEGAMIPRSHNHIGVPGRSHFMELPEELLLKIVTYNNYPDTGLWSLCLTNKTLNRIATTVLYSTYTCTNKPTMRKFLTSLIQHPDRIPYLKRIQLTETWSDFRPPSNQGQAPRPIQELIMSWKDQNVLNRYLTEDLIPENEAEDLYLLICLAHKLTELSWHTPGNYWPEQRILNLLGILSEANDMLTPPGHDSFSTLRKLTLNDQREYGTSPAYLEKIFRLPSLKELVCHVRFDLIDGQWPKSWPRRTSSLELTTFTGSRCTSSAIGRLLKACKALKHFSFQCDHMYFDPEMGPETFSCIDYEELAQGLSIQKDSLESLEFTFGGVSMEAEFDANSWAIPFNEFGKLRKLNISIHGLDQHVRGDTESIQSNFPPSLEELTINFWGNVPEDFVRPESGIVWSTKPLRILAQRIPTLSRLRQVTVILLPGQERGHDLNAIRRVFRKQGVTIDVYLRPLCDAIMAEGMTLDYFGTASTPPTGSIPQNASITSTASFPSNASIQPSTIQPAHPPLLPLCLHRYWGT